MSTLYEKIGGKDAVNAAVDLFYNKVLSDERVNSFFENISMKEQRRKQVMFFTYAFGGLQNYSGSSMREVHKKLVDKGLDDSHFDAIMENLGATLVELNIPEELILEAAGIAESTRTDVLNR